MKLCKYLETRVNSENYGRQLNNNIIVIYEKITGFKVGNIQK